MTDDHERMKRRRALPKGSALCLSGHPIVICCCRMSRSCPSGPMIRTTRTSRTSLMKRCARIDRCCWSLTSHPSSPCYWRTRRSDHDPVTSSTSCRSSRSSDRTRSCSTHCEHLLASSATPRSRRHRPCSSRSTKTADPDPTPSARRPATSCRDHDSSCPTRRSCRSGRCSMSLRCSGRDPPYASPPKPVTSSGARHAASLPASSG